LEEIRLRVFEKYAFCISCLGFQDKAFSLILLVFPYTKLTRALNCLFVFPYMKMLRHYLILDPFQHSVFAKIVGNAREQDGATSWRHILISPTHISKLEVDQGDERETQRE